MKTNIIHILILAIILIVGWSLFTVLQDFSNRDSLKYDNYSTITKGKKYLPLTPEGYSRQQKYPVYTVPSHVQAQMNQDQLNNKSVPYSAVENGLAVNPNNNINSASNSFNSIERVKHSSIAANRTSQSLSKNRKMSAPSDLSKTTTFNSNIGGSFSEGNRIIRAMRSAADGNVVEQQGRKKGDKSPYNSVPVGEGLSLLFFMGALYALIKIYKK